MYFFRKLLIIYIVKIKNGDSDMKYTVYDNSNKLFESDNIYSMDIFMTLNPSGNLLYFHKENDIFIMYFECYTVYYKEK